MATPLGPLYGLLEGALQGLDRKGQIVAQNVANLETPGYKAEDVRFTHTLSQALKSGSVGAEVVPAPGAARNDGNTVDLETQLGEANQVALAQEGVMAAMNARLQALHAVISDLSSPGV